MRDVRPEDPPRDSRREHDVPGTPYDADLEGLHDHAEQQLRGPPVRIDRAQAEPLLEQFQQTATYRGWALLAMAIMVNHLHLVVSVPGDPDPIKVLGDFKAYGSRTLNRRWGKPPSETWWTYGGSKRKPQGEQALQDAIDYVLHRQPNPLLVWNP